MFLFIMVCGKVEKLHFLIEEEIGKDVDTMCNLSQGIKEEGTDNKYRG